MKMLLQIDYLLLLLHKHSSEAVLKQALSDRIQTGVEYRLRQCISFGKCGKVLATGVGKWYSC